MRRVHRSHDGVNWSAPMDPWHAGQYVCVGNISMFILVVMTTSAVSREMEGDWLVFFLPIKRFLSPFSHRLQGWCGDQQEPLWAQVPPDINVFYVFAPRVFSTSNNSVGSRSQSLMKWITLNWPFHTGPHKYGKYEYIILAPWSQ
jgi:hypothetical protein